MSKDVKLNPRFVLWAASIGKTPSELMHADRDGVTKIDGTPWTVLFMVWTAKRWRQWALELGYPDHRVALANGYTHADFDAWLEKNNSAPEAK